MQALIACDRRHIPQSGAHGRLTQRVNWCQLSTEGPSSVTLHSTSCLCECRTLACTSRIAFRHCFGFWRSATRSSWIPPVLRDRRTPVFNTPKPRGPAARLFFASGPHQKKGRHPKVPSCSLARYAIEPLCSIWARVGCACPEKCKVYEARHVPTETLRGRIFTTAWWDCHPSPATTALP